MAQGPGLEHFQYCRKGGGGVSPQKNARVVVEKMHGSGRFSWSPSRVDPASRSRTAFMVGTVANFPFLFADASEELFLLCWEAVLRLAPAGGRLEGHLLHVSVSTWQRWCVQTTGNHHIGGCSRVPSRTFLCLQESDLAYHRGPVARDF